MSVFTKLAAAIRNFTKDECEQALVLVEFKESELLEQLKQVQDTKSEIISHRDTLTATDYLINGEWYTPVTCLRLVFGYNYEISGLKGTPKGSLFAAEMYSLFNSNTHTVVVGKHSYQAVYLKDILRNEKAITRIYKKYTQTKVARRTKEYRNLIK